MIRKILVIASHPDDEILGVGGTLSRFAREGSEVHIVVLGEGITSRQGQRAPEDVKKEIERLHGEVVRAATRIGAKSAEVLRFPDNRFDSVDLLDIVKAIESKKAAVKPNVVFTHHQGDLNIDHRCTANAVVTACRPLEGEVVREIYTFETLSSTEWQIPNPATSFCPNFFVSITEEDLRAKIEAMEIYSSERRAAPHPRSPQTIEALARLRGSSIGVEFAEAFVTIRRIV